MKQINLFGQEFAPKKEQQKYSSKIEAPIYEPKNIKPFVLELYDNKKYHRLIKEINASKLSDDEKRFLLVATIEMQNLMEKSGLVIIDFEKAIEYGYVKLCDDIRNQYLEEYGE